MRVMSWLSDVWNRLERGGPNTPSQVRVHDDHVLGQPPSRPFVAEQDYVVIEINELRLDYSRRWWQGFVPSLWVSTELRYGGRTETVPVLIGPTTLPQPDAPTPTEQVFGTTRVLGPVPYRGGTVGLSLVLSQVAADDRAARVVAALESVAKAVRVSGTLAPYLAVGKVIGDSLATLLDLGSRPLLGVHDTVTADSGAHGGWYALFDTPPTQELWVIDGRLHAGPDPATAPRMTGSSYVLYSVTPLPGDGGRNDADSLPDLAEQRALVEQFALRAEPSNWTTAKSIFAELGVRLLRHPDLTRTQAEQLFGSWGADLVRQHEQAVAFSIKGSAEPEPDDLAQVRSIVTRVMEL